MPRFASIEEVMASYPDRFLPDKAEGVDGVIEFQFTGGEGQAYHMVIRDRTLDVREGGHEAPTVTVTVPGEAWLGVNNGEIRPMGLLMQGKLKVKGSLALAAKFQQMFVAGSDLS